jgi:nitroreductase
VVAGPSVSDADSFGATGLPTDVVGLLEGLCSTRAIRRYRDEPVPDEALRAMLFAATRAPSGSNRQPFRFLVLRDGPVAERAKALIGGAARALWAAKRTTDGYDRTTAPQATSVTTSATTSESRTTPKSETTQKTETTPKQRMAAAMEDYVEHFERVPVLVLPCLMRYREPSPFEGSSIYPACQNLLLAARALGYGGVLTGFHGAVDAELRELCAIPEGTAISATITIGRPMGSHGPVRRRPLQELVFADRWDEAPTWAVDPPGTAYTQAGPPKRPRPS